MIFFAISQFVSWIISPVSQLAILLVAQFFLKEKWQVRCKYLLLALFLFYTSPITSWLASRAWDIKGNSFESIEEPFDIGIVLGGMTNMRLLPTDRPHFNSNVDRLTDAITLYRRGKVGKLLLSGGSGLIEFPELRESIRLKDYLMGIGIPPEDIVLEDQSNNTRQNAVFTASIIKEEYPNANLLLITSASHMRRANGCFEKAGLPVTPFSVDQNSNEAFEFSYTIFIPNVDALQVWTKLTREWVGYLVYWLIGYV